MTEPTRTLSIVTPVYFNADSLPLLFVEFRPVEDALLSRGVAVELIFVDDGSGDASLDELLKIKGRRPATKVVSLTRNFGAVAAMKTGMRFVTGDAFIFVSADLQDPLEQIVSMVDKWMEGNKFVISARASREDPFSTKLFARIYYALVKRLIAPDYPRGGFDLMLMDRVMLPHMLDSTKHTYPQLYSFWLGFKPTVLYYHRRARPYGRSRWTFRKKLKLFADSLSGFSAAPIRILSLIGIFVALVSFAYGVTIALTTLLWGAEVRGFASLAVLISFFSGLILIMLGVLGEYLWRLLEAVNSKPEGVIDETFL